MPVTEEMGNLWDLHHQGHWIAITTNGILKSDGRAVMGAGLAKQAAGRFPDLPRVLGTHIRTCGNTPMAFPGMRIITLPTKHHFRDASDIGLIQESLRQVQGLLTQNQIDRLYCPRPGCGLGQLTWQQVRAAIAPVVDYRCIFLHPIG